MPPKSYLLARRSTNYQHTHTAISTSSVSLEKAPGLKVIFLHLTHASVHLLLKRGIYLARECLECSDVSPGAGARSMRGECRRRDGSLAGPAWGLTPVKDADTAMGVFGKVSGSWGSVRFSS